MSYETMVSFYIFSAAGDPVGFVHNRRIFDLSGRPVGQLHGVHVHSILGKYVGELDGDMIVDKHLGDYGTIGSLSSRESVALPGNPPRSRAASRSRDTDVWSMLLR